MSNKLNFFCDIDTLNYLIGLEYPEDHPTVDISVDFIEAPFWFVFSADAENWKLRTIQRGELFTHDESMAIDIGTLTVNKSTGEGTGNTTNQMLHQNFGAFFQACRNLSFYVHENDLEAKFGELNPEEAGIMLASDGENLTCKIVSGKDRPEVMCATLFGGMTMMRPYMEDFWERSEADFMSLEEKIEAAEAGDEYVMENLANLYLNGDDDVKANPEQAVYWFTKLAELDNSDAQFNLGLHCAKGHGIKRDFEKAAYWMQRAADNGDEDAPALLEKYTKAAEAIKKIDSGDAQAQADLAGVLMALAGSLEQAGTTEDDYNKAFELATKSAEQDNGDGIWALALCYEHGRGVAANVDIAIELYERGAELGHAPSQHSLACYYFRGDVLEQDNKKAFDLCMKSAEQGYGLAMADVGRCYQFGNGVMGNMKTAVEWCEKALEVIDDPELERKTAMFKMIGENDEHWGEDYPGTDEDDFDDEEDGSDLPDGFMAALEAFEEAEEYENELADEGVIPDAPRPGNGVMNLSPEGFPRIAQKAEEGDERAIAIIEKMKAANEME